MNSSQLIKLRPFLKSNHEEGTVILCTEDGQHSVSFDSNEYFVVEELARTTIPLEEYIYWVLSGGSRLPFAQSLKILRTLEQNGFLENHEPRAGRQLRLPGVGFVGSALLNPVGFVAILVGT